MTRKPPAGKRPPSTSTANGPDMPPPPELWARIDAALERKLREEAAAEPTKPSPAKK